MKQMDEELAAKIKAVFNDYDDGQAKNGWTELRKKYPEKENQKLPIWWITGIAASILIVFGLFLIFNQTTLVSKNQQQVAEALNTTPQLKTEKNSINIAKSTIEESAMQATANLEIANKSIVAKESITKSLERKPFSIVPKQDQAFTSEQNPVNTSPRVIAQLINPIEPQKTITESAIAVIDKTAISQESITKIVVEPTEEPKKSTEEFLKAQSQILASQKPKNTTANINSAHNSIDVFTGTFVNYANNDTKVSMGVGINANVKLSKKVVVSFGAGISQNKIDYHDNNNSNAAADLATAANSSFLSNSNVMAAKTTTDVKVAAQILNFDIPIVFKFYPGAKQNIYFAAGINSNTYLSQKYSYEATTINTVAPNSLSISKEPLQKTEVQEVEEGNLKGFDFANSAIFAIGINKKVGKTNLIIFEPYFKPVIGTMGNKNLKINTVGLNLKFNFTNKK